MSLAGKVTLVTGGGAGLGLAMASALAVDGAAVAIVDVRAECAEHAAAGLAAEGHQSYGTGGDVGDRAEIDKVVDEVVAHLGPIGILVNNAGLYDGYTGGFGALTEAQTRQLFDVNVHGVINCTLACVASMRAAGGGVVVHIASDAGYHSRHPYGVTKLAVRGLAVAFATELAPDGIRVNAIAPGLIGTDHALSHVGTEAVADRVLQRQLVARLGRVDDIVEALRYLVSDQASFVTGQTLRVNGGIDLAI